jgi:histidine triad (HIT) family protein
MPLRIASAAATTSCVFCSIVREDTDATVIRTWPEAQAIVPLNPVTPGHTLVIPRRHVIDFTEDPEVSAATMRRAAELAAGVGPVNLITSKGREATQSVFHLHIHLVPRTTGDGLPLPWTPQQAASRPCPAVAHRCGQQTRPRREIREAEVSPAAVPLPRPAILWRATPLRCQEPVMSEHHDPGERLLLDEEAADAVRAYAAKKRASTDRLAAALEDIAANGLPPLEECIPWEDLRDDKLAQLAQQRGHAA